MAPNVLERQVLRARNGLAHLAGSDRPQVARTPRDLVWQRDTARLWRYRSDQRRHAPPVLIVHSLVSKSYVLDLLPGTSMVGYLVEAGFDLYLLDWEAPGPADAANTLESYADGYVPAAIEALLRESAADGVTLIGYCFGGVLTLLTAAGHPEVPVRNLVVMACPCDFGELGFMSRMFLEHRLDAEDVIDETGLVPPSALDEGFQAMKPTDRVAQRVNLVQNLWNAQWIENFLAMGQWARDQIPFPGAAFRQTVDVLIRENALMGGAVPFGGGEVRLADITCPVLNAYAERDEITPSASSKPLSGLLGSDDVTDLCLESGHVGFVAGRQSVKVAKPKISDWIRARSD